MNKQELVAAIRQKQSYLCVGLDTNIEKIPAFLRQDTDAIIRFNRAIIDATLNHCVSYKVNTAFYEVLGARGWEIMQQTFDYIPATHLKIADAKRGDIGNTSDEYARAFFETLGVDAVTVAPYMGEDSLKPFLAYENKWTIVLALTSNAGSRDFQRQQLAAKPNQALGEQLFERVIDQVASWGTTDNLMFVVGATQAAEIGQIRKRIPDHFLLVPGVGFQGGNLYDVSKQGLNQEIGLLINASRSVIYASGGQDYATAASLIAQEYQVEMSDYLQNGF